MPDPDKIVFIKAYFDKWESDVKRAAELLADRYHLEGILALSCYLGALAALRVPHPEHGDREAYVRAVLDYSGKRDFFELIDLPLLYQWPRSKLSDIRDKSCRARH